MTCSTDLRARTVENRGRETARDPEIPRFAEIQSALLDLVSPLSEHDCRAQFHPELSPLGWHLGHATFIENRWIRAALSGESDATDSGCGIYLPRDTGKAARGALLPDKNTLIDDCRRMQRDNLALLENPPPALAACRLMRDGYLLKFLVQHHAMHLETMYMILTERQLRGHERGHRPRKRLQPAAVSLQPVAFDGGELEIGGRGAWCFDNELPRHRETLRPFAINARPVSNAEFLGFIESGGYDEPGWWDDAGLRWLRRAGAGAPHHWRDDDTGAWYGINERGCHDLEAGDPVHGLSHHEARAFARYAGARLPRESEWEAARLQDPAGERILPNGRTWEWCGNAFNPYPGFKPFPYREYSTPWFDGAHYSLRGYSRYTPDVLHRPTFRNFYAAGKRHVFAGLRLAMR